MERDFTTLPSTIPFEYATNCSDYNFEYSPNTTIILKAPVNGIYGFMIRIYATIQDTMVALVVDSKEMIQMKIDMGYPLGSFIFPILELKKADEVSLFLLNGNVSTASVVGWLVSELK